MNTVAHISASNAKRRTSTAPASILQRACACNGSAHTGGECEGCRKKKLQRRAASANGPAVAPPIVHDVLRSSGQPLDHTTRSFFEPRFGHNFGNVRVHTDDKAAESARAVNALAYTVGTSVVFDRGQFAPHSGHGRKLLAHELTHVMQQGATESHEQPLTVGALDDTYEHQAERISSSILSATRPSAVRHASSSTPGMNLLRVPGGATVIQRQVPTGISLKEYKPFG